MSDELSIREAGRKGGRATTSKHGIDHMKELGRRGAEAFKEKMQDPAFRDAHAKASQQGRQKRSTA